MGKHLTIHGADWPVQMIKYLAMLDIGVVGILEKSLMCCCHCVLQDRSGQGGPGAGDASAKIYSH